MSGFCKLGHISDNMYINKIGITGKSFVKAKKVNIRIIGILT